MGNTLTNTQRGLLHRIYNDERLRELFNNYELKPIYEQTFMRFYEAIFTEALLKLNINPLQYMTTIISHMFSSDSKWFMDIDNLLKGTNITSIDEYAFQNSCIRTITIPDTVTEIHSGAFSFCSNLESVYGMRNVVNFDFDIFTGCTSLKQLHIYGSTTTVPTDMCNACGGLEVVYIDEGIRFIKSQAFEGCPSLQEVRLPKSLEVIRKDVFRNCIKLKDLKYAGTMNDWQNVIMSDKWIDHKVKIYCSDGVVTDDRFV